MDMGSDAVGSNGNSIRVITRRRVARWSGERGEKLVERPPIAFRVLTNFHQSDDDYFQILTEIFQTVLAKLLYAVFINRNAIFSSLRKKQLKIKLLRFVSTHSPSRRGADSALERGVP